MPTITAGASTAITVAVGTYLEGTGAGMAVLGPAAVVEPLTAGDAWQIGPFDRSTVVNISAASAITYAVKDNMRDPSEADKMAVSTATALQASVLGSATITRAALITLAEANGLTPGALYITTDGLQCQALTARFLQPLGPWFMDGRRWSVGAATSAADLTHTYLPPLAPNACLEIFHQWRMDGTNVTKRGRIYIDGTLGGGITGAQAVYVDNYTDTNVQRKVHSHMMNRNLSDSQICFDTAADVSFNSSSTQPAELTVSTNTSKLLRAMGETSKSGSNVTITGITRVGTTATATSTAHGLTTGDYIGVTGAISTGAAQYNADPVAVTVVDANTFTYVMASDPGASASGSPVFQKYVSLALVMFRVEIRQGLGF